MATPDGQVIWRPAVPACRQLSDLSSRTHPRLQETSADLYPCNANTSPATLGVPSFGRRRCKPVRGYVAIRRLPLQLGSTRALTIRRQRKGVHWTVHPTGKVRDSAEAYLSRHHRHRSSVRASDRPAAGCCWVAVEELGLSRSRFLLGCEFRSKVGNPSEVESSHDC